MPKFNTRDRRSAANPGPLSADPNTRTTTGEGGVGYTRDNKSDAFLLAATSVDLTADAFYESGDARVRRFTHLISQTAVEDPDWTYRFLTWLRTKGNVRTAAVVGGVEAARAMVAAGIPGGRHMISTVLRRADEPGEALAYHFSKHGRAVSWPLKRGIADAARRLYNERALLKYDTASHGVRFADVLALTHASPDPAKAHWQGALFQYAIDRRYGRGGVPTVLETVRRNGWLRARFAEGVLTEEVVHPEVIRNAAMTWEDVLSALGSKVDKAALWRALIPSMGFMARIRNLRNFDQAGLTDDDVRPVIEMLSDPDQVAASKQFPLRFLSAYRNAPSLRWAYPLEQALDAAVGNVPHVKGRTLIVVDTSLSMRNRLSGRSELMRWDAAAAFAIALARRCDNPQVVSFSGAVYSSHNYASHVVAKEFPTRRGESLLRSIDRWKRDGYFIGGGTNTAATLRWFFSGHDRVVLFTDEQVGDYGYDPVEVNNAVPANVPMTTFNLAGYPTSHAPTGPNRLLLGGLTDAMFPVIAQFEQRRPGNWPWTGDPHIPGLPEYRQHGARTAPAGARAATGPRSTVPDGYMGGGDGPWEMSTR